MKKLLAALLLLPSLCFADRLGSIRSGTEVMLSTQGIRNQNTLQTGATSYPDYSYIGTSETINGPLWLRGTLNSELNNFVNQPSGGYWMGSLNSFLVGMHTTSAGGLQLRTFAGDMYNQDANGAITIASSVTITGTGLALLGTGDSEGIFTLYGGTYTVSSSSYNQVGSYVVFTSTWGTLGVGATPTGGSGTPGGSAFQVQYSSANGTAFAGSPNMTNNGSTVTFSGIYAITETNVSSKTYSGVYFDYTGSTLTVSKVTITSNTIMTGATFYQNGLIQLGGGVSASLPMKTDANKFIVTAAVDLSGAEATGTMAAARMPALTGDITTSAGAVATTITNSIPNIHNWAGAATFASSVTINNAVLMGAAASAVTISSNAVTPGATFYQNGIIGTNLSASLPVKTDASKFLTAAAVNLSGSEVTGTMAAARMPALTGDITTSAGAVATTLTNLIPNKHSWSGASTFTSSMTVINDFLLQVGTMTLQSPPQIPNQTLTVINLIAPKAAGQLIACSDCTALTICVSTGTGIGAWASPTAKTTACR